MIPGMPAFGARFSLEKADAKEIWKVFWMAVDPQAVKGSLLFAGAAEADGSRVYVIALQSMSQAIVSGARDALAGNDAFATARAEPAFLDVDELSALPLKPFGNITSAGRLEGESGVSLDALRDVRPEMATAAGPQTAVEAPKGFAAKSTTIGSHAARAFLSGNTSSRQTAGPGTTRTTIRHERSSSFKVGVALIIVAFIVGLGVMMYYRVERSAVDGGEPLPVAPQ